MRREKFIIAAFLIILSIVTTETIYIFFEKPNKSTSEKYSRRSVKPEMIKQKKEKLENHVSFLCLSLLLLVAAFLVIFFGFSWPGPGRGAWGVVYRDPPRMPYSPTNLMFSSARRLLKATFS